MEISTYSSYDIFISVLLLHYCQQKIQNLAWVYSWILIKYHLRMRQGLLISVFGGGRSQG